MQYINQDRYIHLKCSRDRLKGIREINLNAAEMKRLLNWIIGSFVEKSDSTVQHSIAQIIEFN